MTSPQQELEVPWETPASPMFSVSLLWAGWFTLAPAHFVLVKTGGAPHLRLLILVGLLGVSTLLGGTYFFWMWQLWGEKAKRMRQTIQQVDLVTKLSRSEWRLLSNMARDGERWVQLARSSSQRPVAQALVDRKMMTASDAEENERRYTVEEWAWVWISPRPGELDSLLVEHYEKGGVDDIVSVLLLGDRY